MMDFPLPVVIPRKEYDTMCRCSYNIALARIKMKICLREESWYYLPQGLPERDRKMLEEIFTALEFTENGKVLFTEKDYRLDDLERQLLFFDSALSFDWLVNGKRQVHLLEQTDPMVYEVLEKMGYSIGNGCAGL